MPGRLNVAILALAALGIQAPGSVALRAQTPAVDPLIADASMPRRRLAAAAWCAILLAIVQAVMVRAQERPSAASLVDGASEYMTYFVRELSNVVAEEQYSQSYQARTDGLRTRKMRSDFLLIKAITGAPWMQYRDVTDVDGTEVKDRVERLTSILGDRTAPSERSRRVWAESARFNIGFQRTFNLPLIAIGFLQRNVRPRFTFDVDRADPGTAPDVWIVSFEERARPTVMKTDGGDDVFSKGRLWISAGRGLVWKSELTVELERLNGRVVTEFVRDPRYPVLVPGKMAEEYTLLDGSKLTSEATYGSFRRFQVHTQEALR